MVIKDRFTAINNISIRDRYTTTNNIRIRDRFTTINNISIRARFLPIILDEQSPLIDLLQNVFCLPIYFVNIANTAYVHKENRLIFLLGGGGARGHVWFYIKSLIIVYS